MGLIFQPKQPCSADPECRWITKQPGVVNGTKMFAADPFSAVRWDHHASNLFPQNMLTPVELDLRSEKVGGQVRTSF